MNLFAPFVVFLAVFTVLAHAIRRLQQRENAFRWLPDDLVGSQLVYSEKTFAISHPIKLTVRVDRIYHDGAAMALVELKTRCRDEVYASDIIELSAQRLAVQYGTRDRIHDFGFVLLQHPITGRRICHKVVLLSEAEVLGIANRRELLLARALLPCDAAGSGRCHRCEYRKECASDSSPGQRAAHEMPSRPS